MTFFTDNVCLRQTRYTFPELISSLTVKLKSSYIPCHYNSDKDRHFVSHQQANWIPCLELTQAFHYTAWLLTASQRACAGRYQRCKLKWSRFIVNLVTIRFQRTRLYHLISCFQPNALVRYIFSYSSTCFEPYCAHHQEDLLYIHSIWFFMCHSSCVTFRCTGS